MKGKREYTLEKKRGSGLFSCELEQAWLKVETKGMLDYSCTDTY